MSSQIAPGLIFKMKKPGSRKADAEALGRSNAKGRELNDHAHPTTNSSRLI